MHKLQLTLTVSFIVGVSACGMAADFTSGNLAVLRADASVSNTTGAILEIGKTAGSIIQTIPIDSTTAAALRFSGSASGTGYLSTTNDGRLLSFAGINTTNGAGNATSFLARGVGTVNFNAQYNLATTYSGISGNQARSASSLDNTAFYISDQGGLYTNNATTPSPSGNFRNVRTFAGTVYGSTTSSTTSQVGTFSATTQGTYTPLPGLSSNQDLQDFYLIRSGSNGSTFDILYITSALSNTSGRIAKFSLVGGNWISNGTANTTFGGFGLAVEDNGIAPGANLYLTTGDGGLANNTVQALTDINGFNAVLDLTAATTIFSAPTGTVLKGIEFVPVPEPFALSFLSISSVLLIFRRKLTGI
ncbi:hypothetical protein BH11PLA2_BH11PLA2_50010 [soil metagenome]